LSLRKPHTAEPQSGGGQALPASPTLREMLRYAERRIDAAGLSFGHGSGNAHDEAAYMMLYAMGLPPHQLEPYLDQKLNAVQRDSALQLIERRINERMPAAYLTHEAWLLGHRFYVDERVIVPRSFIAELLPEGIDPWLAEPDSVRTVLDMCTGSGCLAILAALAFPDAHVDAVDISTDALQVARRNVDEYGLDSRLRLIESDLFNGIAGRRYDLVVANPPYVDAKSMRKLPDEYRKEPKLALAAGNDGLSIVNRILRAAGRHLAPDGVVVIEIGHNRAALEKAYPRLEFIWLEVAAGDEFVFLLTAEQLRALDKPGNLPLRRK
jgi:ribosomal protein L3 glutamine methyltransferase